VALTSGGPVGTLHLVHVGPYQGRDDDVTTRVSDVDTACSRGARRSAHRARYGWRVLVLGRRVGESIVISGEITVTVLEVRGEMVRVGIEAPRSVAVQRAELLRELEESNKASASPSEDAVEALSRRLGGRAQP
jgi:carbon storage regulator